MKKEASLLQLGERIREIRLGKGMSQKKLALSIGKDQQSIQRLEQGKTNPSYFYLKEIANGLEITLSELIKDL
jgi:transcriptional regulator with XRE-family HTH domain